MNIALIKKINEKMPYWMKRPFAHIIRGRLINNSVFLETYDSLLRLDQMNKDEIKEEQKQKLLKTLKHAYEHSNYYHALFDENDFSFESLKDISDIQRLPLLTKELLKEHLSEIVTDDNRDYYTVTTGGTTGEPTKVLMSKSAIFKEWAFIYHYWSKFGYNYKSSRLATFRGIEMGNKISEINPLYAEIRMNPFILNFDNVERYLQLIKKFRADFLYGYPSAIYNFCRLAKKRNINISNVFKAAFLISENLYDFQKELINSVLQCPIVIFYGHSERAVFAEKYENGYVFNPFYGVTEISENGEPVVTGFINEKTPLIRYVVDDYVEKNDKDGFVIWGHRESDMIIGKNGEQIRASLLNFHGELFEKYGQFQIIQEKEGELKIRLVGKKDQSDGDIEAIIDRMDSILNGQFKLSMEFADDLDLTSRGKYKFLIQKLNL